MPLFKKDNEEIYLICNYKVMYSTLSKSALLRCSNRRLARIIVWDRFRLKPTQIHLIVRNPYDRLESFFRDKLRQNCIRKTNEDAPCWQDVQKLFFAPLRISDSMPTAQISETLMSVSFSRFVSMLPEIYNKDRHLQPQFWKLLFPSDTRARFRLQIPVLNTYRIESSTDLKILQKKFTICLDDKKNSTESIRESVQIEWRASERKIVNEIYAKDFQYFNYQKFY